MLKQLNNNIIKYVFDFVLKTYCDSHSKWNTAMIKNRTPRYLGGHAIKYRHTSSSWSACHQQGGYALPLTGNMHHLIQNCMQYTPTSFWGSQLQRLRRFTERVQARLADGSAAIKKLVWFLVHHSDPIQNSRLFNASGYLNLS